MYDSYWEELEHTADVAARVWGADRAALFTHAAGATISLIGDNLSDPGPPVTRQITLTAGDAETLLVDWLTEIIILAEEGIAVNGVTITAISPTSLSAHLTGVTNAHFSNHIKAVTYTGLQIVETERGLETEIVYDV